MDKDNKSDYTNIHSQYSEISWTPPKSEDLIASLKPNPTIIGGTKTYNYPMFGTGTASYTGKVGTPLLVNSVMDWQINKLGNRKIHKWSMPNDRTFRIILNSMIACKEELFKGVS